MYPMENNSFVKTLGIKYAEETALGADITTRLYKSFLKENKQDYYITTACHSLNLLVENIIQS